MYRGSFVLRFIAALVVLGLLIGAGYLAYRTGFEQGFVQGAAVPEEGAPLDRPVYPYHPGYWRPHFGFFPSFPFFGFFFVGLLIFWLVGGLFRRRYWGYPGYWHHHDHPYGAPPWEKERPSGEAGKVAQAPPGRPESDQS
jgi:hypothetical protein